MLCPKCGKNEITNCGYGEIIPGTPSNPTEYECSFWWHDTLDECDGCARCPLIWCKECKDTALFNYWVLVRSFLRTKE